MLVITAAAMIAFLGMLALALDVGTWYQTEHHAQGTADATALAAANYMAGGDSASDAQVQAVTYAGYNGLTITTANVVINTTTNQVTVTVPTTAPSYFAQALGFGSRSVSAKAVATWPGGVVPYSLIAGSSACGAGYGLTFKGTGGGTTTVTGMHTNGQLTNQDHSNSSSVSGTISSNASGTGPNCTPSITNSGNTSYTVNGSPSAAFPLIYAQPTGPACTYTATSFTTAQIAGPGVYCATGTNTSCLDGSSNGAGSIYLNQIETGVELVAGCVVLAGGAGNSTAPSGQPLVYGTAGAASPPATSVYIDNNGNVLTGTIYAPSGTVEFTQNNNITTFVEAANIVIDGNGFTVIGNGPPTVSGGDSLTG